MATGLLIRDVVLFLQFYAYIFPKLDLVNMKTDFLNRNVNEGFSGGERKRNEILQLAVWSLTSNKSINTLELGISFLSMHLLKLWIFKF